jgi:hypothetical protein
MNVSAIIRRACPDYGQMAKKAGLSPDYVRHLVKPTDPRPAGYEARHKLARALREQAAQLAADADALESAERRLQESER